MIFLFSLIDSQNRTNEGKISIEGACTDPQDIPQLFSNI